MSVPLVLEYKAVATRMVGELSVDESGLEEVVGYLCGIAEPVEIHFLWRPLLPDPKDDMVLELAVAGRCDDIVTRGARGTGMSVLSLRLPESLHNAARKLAEEENISINQLITLALAEKILALTTEQFFAERAKRGSRAGFERVMARLR